MLCFSQSSVSMRMCFCILFFYIYFFLLVLYVSYVPLHCIFVYKIMLTMHFDMIKEGVNKTRNVSLEILKKTKII